MEKAWISLLALVACACTVFGVQGSGNVVTETRDVSGFDEIVLMGSGDVIVDVTGIESLVIEAEDNIIPLLTTEVVDGRLELGASEPYSTDIGVTYTITASELTGVTIEGSGDVTANRIDADGFAATIEGSGNVTAGGTSNDLFVTIDGSGSVDALDLETDNATVTINGSGDALVDASTHLVATINGSGNVTYAGNPTVDETINGSGEVAPR